MLNRIDVLNDPVNYIDPEGKWVQFIAPTIIVVATAGSVWLFKDCMERCTGKKCGEIDKEPKNFSWCFNYCFDLSGLLGMAGDPLGGTSTEVGVQIGEEIAK